MSRRRYDREPTHDGYRPQPGRYRDDGGQTDDYRNSPRRDYPQRSLSPRRRYSPPPYDQGPKPDTGELKIKGASKPIERSGDQRHDENDIYDNRRERSLSPRPAPRRPHRDRSPSPYDRVRNRNRSRHKSQDRVHERSRDRSRERPRYRSRSRSYDGRRDRSPFYGGPASREVILEGLPLDWVEDDVRNELTSHHNVGTLDDVRVIRDRHTRKSRCFGFIRFPSLEDSRAFVETRYPTIPIRTVSPSRSERESAVIRLAYSREREERGNQVQPGDWRCPNCQFTNFKGRSICYQCQTAYNGLNNVELLGKPQYTNSGDSDVAPDGLLSQFLLVRGLEPTVTEELFARGVSKLFKPSNRQPPPAAIASKKGGSKVQSTTGDANLGAKEGTLRRVLLIRDRRSNESWRYGFAEYASVDDAQAALTRYNSFDKFTIASKPVLADYIHAGVFVPVLNADQQNPQFSFSPLGNTATKLAYWDQDAYASELVVAEAPPSTADESNSAANENTSGDKDGKAKKRKADAKESVKQKKATPAHLQFWSDRHAELHGKKQIAGDSDGTTLEGEEIDDTAEEIDTALMASYVDPGTHCCWLCMRQLESEKTACQHERTSELHRRNLVDEIAVNKAKARLVGRSVPARDILHTWIDLAGRCCYLCDIDFDTIKDVSRHENLSTLHRRNLTSKNAMRKGKELLGTEQIIPTTVTDPYLDPIGRCCYLCMTEFRDAESVFRHGYTSQIHRTNLKVELTVDAANAKVGKIHRIVPQPLPETFVDALGKACYLCRKQFRNSDETEKHISLSRIHRKRISNEADVQAANAWLGNSPDGEFGATFDDPTEYRDRAAERRQAFGSSKKISLAFKKPGNKREDQSKLETPTATPSKGASLMGKMGWSAGDGLGAQGTGATAPIATDMYVQGVGLGAHGGRIGDAAEEASRNTKGDYTEFLEKTRDKAKERFEKMS